MSDEKRIRELALELYNAVEETQGELYISDQFEADSLPELKKFVEHSLYNSRENSKRIAAFLRKHRRALGSSGERGK